MPDESPSTFLRRYAKSWVHAVATALMTAFGTLTFVDGRFAALAIAAYVVPPVVLYARQRRDDDSPRADDRPTGDEATDPDENDLPTNPDESGHPTNPDENGHPTNPGESGREWSWWIASVPTEADLNDLASTADATYAVGEGGVVLADPGDGWRTLLADGPRAEGNDLAAVDATDAGAWVVGDAGTVARFDPGTGRHVDHSAPDGDTSDLVAVAASTSDDAAGERLLIGDSSGRLRHGEYRDGEVAWRDPTTPGSGSSIAGATAVPGIRALVCDTNQCLFETIDDGRTYRRLDVGDVSGTFTDVAATADATVVSTDAGVVHEDGDGVWTPTRASVGALCAVTATDESTEEGARWLACGADGSVVVRPVDGTWTATETPTEATLNGVTVTDGIVVAARADGVVLERRRD